MEKLRHVLDSPEGLIARLQYLEIAMTPTEQGALVAKFGSQLQNAVTARFDRVERTLAQMERFLDFQKPLLRLDLYIALNQPITSAMIGDEAIYVRIHGLTHLGKTLSYLCVNHTGHLHSGNAQVTLSYGWHEDTPAKVISFSPSMSFSTSLMTSFTELSLTNGGQRVRIADLTIIGIEAYCTDGIHDKIGQIVLDANGYQLFSCLPDNNEEATALRAFRKSKILRFYSASMSPRNVLKVCLMIQSVALSLR